MSRWVKIVEGEDHPPGLPSWNGRCHCGLYGDLERMHDVSFIHHRLVPVSELEAVILELDGKLVHFDDVLTGRFVEERGQWLGSE